MEEHLHFLNKGGISEKKLRLISSSEKVFDEKWLQGLLIASPGLLPVHEIDAQIAPLIPLGREVSVTSGAIDNLYITSEGQICLVETKLWRNPEAHREVVAQIIDYAKDLSKMSFEEFVEIVESSQLGNGKPGFWERVEKHAREIQKIEFQSKVQEELEHGRFLLLIVGDRIYSEVALLAEAIQAAPHLEFKIELVEMHFYKPDQGDPWPLLAVPELVGKTHEVVRSVVRIFYEEKKPEVEVTALEEKKGKETKTKTDRKEFESSMQKDYASIFIPVLDKWLALGYSIYWGIIGFSVRVHLNGKLRSAFTVYPDNVGLLTSDQVRKRELPIEPYHQYKEKIDKIPVARRMLKEGRSFAYFRDVTPEEFKLIVDATDELLSEYTKMERKDDLAT